MAALAANPVLNTTAPLRTVSTYRGLSNDYVADLLQDMAAILEQSQAPAAATPPDVAAMTRGAYLEPGAVAHAPDYAAKLADAGVSIFLLRTGFDPQRTAPELEQAITVAERLGAAVWLLAGTWWGHGVATGAAATTLAEPWRRLDAQHLFGDYPAHEAQWPMWPPGGDADAAIVANLEQLARRWNPAAICLTHARFRHPAAIRSLFEAAPGWTEVPQAADWKRVVAGMRASGGRQFAAWSAELDPIGLLDRCAQLGGGAAPFTHWFARRTARVRESVARFLAAARRGGGPALIAGGNAIAAHAAPLCGQDYGALAEDGDFIQPLFGYMEWHVFQCIVAWSRLVRRFIPRVSEAAALESVWRLYGFRTCSLPRREALLTGEGDGTTIEIVVTALLERTLRACPAQRLMPVLRGHDWPAEVTFRLEDLIRGAGCPAVFYQGTTVLAGPPPGPDWQ